MPSSLCQPICTSDSRRLAQHVTALVRRTGLHAACALMLATIGAGPVNASDLTDDPRSASAAAQKHTQGTQRTPSAEQLAVLEALKARQAALSIVSMRLHNVRIVLRDLGKQRQGLAESRQEALHVTLGPDSASEQVAACSSALIAQVGALDAVLDALISAEQRDGLLQMALADKGTGQLKRRLQEQNTLTQQRDGLLAKAVSQFKSLDQSAQQCTSAYQAMVDASNQRRFKAQQARADLPAWEREFSGLPRYLNELIDEADKARRTTWPSLRHDQLPAPLQPWPPHTTLDAALADVAQHQRTAEQALAELTQTKLSADAPWPMLQTTQARGLPLLQDMLQALAAQHYMQAATPKAWASCQAEACRAWRQERAHVAATLAQRQAAWEQWRAALVSAGKTASAPMHRAITTLTDEARLWHQVDLAFYQLETASLNVDHSVRANTDRFEIELQREIDAVDEAYLKAYIEAFGHPPRQYQPAASSNNQSMVYPPVPAAGMRFDRSVEDHGHQRITRLDQEYPGFGTYTYVLVRAQDDWNNRPKVRERVERLIGYLAASTPEGGTIPQASRPRFNLFVLPNDAKQNYNSLLGHEIKARIRSGLMLRPAIRDALMKQPGPFLLTLPTTVKTMHPDSAVVFADLSTVPMQTIQDVAKQYMNGLVASLPSDQKQWKPPAKLGFAMTLISLADDASGFAFHLFPGGEAMAKGR